MSHARLARILDVIAAEPADTFPLRLCRGAAGLLASPGVGIALATDHGLRTLCATAAARRGEELQVELGEGPCYDAHNGGRPVLMGDLANDATWSAFVPGALEAGIQAAFAFPLRAGDVGVGSFNLYRDVPGDLTVEEHADAEVFAQVAVDLLVVSTSEDVVDELFTDPSVHGWEVHQATGMVAAQLGIGVSDAWAVVRAHAYARDRPLSEIAADIVARRLRLEDDR